MSSIYNNVNFALSPLLFFTLASCHPRKLMGGGHKYIGNAEREKRKEKERKKKTSVKMRYRHSPH
jgi:hypothetical protein